MVMMGCEVSSRRYKSRREGRARKIKIRAGRKVQIISNSWISWGDLALMSIVSIDNMVRAT